MPSLLLFLSVCLALSIALTAVVLYPWIVGGQRSDNQLMALNVQSFQQRLAELEADHATGNIDPQSYAEQVLLLKRQLLTAQTPPTVSRVASLKGRLIVLLWLPLLMALVYVLGDDRTPVMTLWQGQDKLGQVADDLLTAKIDLPPAWATEDSTALISAMQTNVYRHAYDPERWMRLSELFMSLEATPQALEALARAYRLAPNDDAIASTYAQVSFFANEGQLTPAIKDVISALLHNHPDHEGAMMLLVLGETKAGNYATAKQWVQRLRKSIASKAGDHTAALANLDTMAQTIDAQAAQAQKSTAQQNQDAIAVSVHLAPELQAQVSASDVLFVSIGAKAGQAPYAVARLPLSAFVDGTAEVWLSDANAMIAGRTLSVAQAAGEALLLNAKISKSGNALAQSGDLLADPTPVAANAKTLSIRIDKVAP